MRKSGRSRLTSGPSARQDAEKAAKARWLMVITHIIAGTLTPLGLRQYHDPSEFHQSVWFSEWGALRNEGRFFQLLSQVGHVPGLGRRLHEGVVAKHSLNLKQPRWTHRIGRRDFGV